MLESMQSEVLAKRMEEMKAFVLEEMKIDQNTADSCYAIALKNQKRRESESFFHRNLVRLQDLPHFSGHQVLIKIQCFGSHLLTELNVDKKQAREICISSQAWGPHH